MKCIKCGNEIPDDSKFCSFCSSPVETTPVQEVTPTPVEEVTPDASVTPTDIIKQTVDSAIERTERKTKLDIKTLIIITLAVLVIVLTVLLFMNYSKKNDNKCNCTNTLVNDNSTTTTKSANEKTNYASGLDISKATSVKVEDENSDRNKNIKFINAFSYKSDRSGFYDTEVGMLFENNNDSLMSGTVYINYYKDGTRIGSDLGSYSLVTPHSKFIVHIQPSFEEEFDSFDVTYNAAMKTSGYTVIPVDNSKITTQKVSVSGSYQINASYTNDSDSEVTYYFGIIYKKGGNDIGYRNTIASNVKKGDTASVKFYDSFAPKDYDDYEVFIYSSYTSNK